MICLILVALGVMLAAPVASQTTAAPPLPPPLDPNNYLPLYPVNNTVVMGMGGVLVVPVLSDVIFSYRFQNSKVNIHNVAVSWVGGSSATEFGTNGRGVYMTSISPISDAMLAFSSQFPMLATAIVPIVNINELGFVADGTSGANAFSTSLPHTLVLSRPVLAAIFDGRIRFWKHPDILSTNTNRVKSILLSLPDPANITVIFRNESIATTNLFTTALKQFDSTFGITPANLLSLSATVKGRFLNISTGKSHILSYRENDGVIYGVRQTALSISYAVINQEMDTAVSGVQIASIVNRNGQTVRPSADSVHSSIMERAPQLTQGTRAVSLFDGQAPQSWPITFLTYLVIRRNSTMWGCKETRAAVEFFRWFYDAPVVGTIAQTYSYYTLPEGIRAELGRKLQNEIQCNNKPAFLYGLKGYAPLNILAPLSSYAAAFQLLNRAVSINFYDRQSYLLDDRNSTTNDTTTSSPSTSSSTTGATIAPTLGAREILDAIREESLLFGLLPTDSVTAALNSNTEWQNSLVTGPVALAGIGIIANLPNGPFAITASTSDLIQFTPVVLGLILAGDITHWNDLRLLAINQLPVANFPFERIIVVRFADDSSGIGRWEYDALYETLSANDPVLRDRIFDAPARPGDHVKMKNLNGVLYASTQPGSTEGVDAVVQTTPFALGIRFRTQQRVAIIPFMQSTAIPATVDAVPQNFSLLIQSLQACTADIAVDTPPPESLLLVLNDSSKTPVTLAGGYKTFGGSVASSKSATCWPWTVSMSVVMRREQRDVDNRCQEKSSPVIAFFGWMLGTDMTYGPFQSGGLAELPPALRLATVESALRRIICVSSTTGEMVGDSPLLSTGPCRPQHLRYISADSASASISDNPSPPPLCSSVTGMKDLIATWIPPKTCSGGEVPRNASIECSFYPSPSVSAISIAITVFLAINLFIAVISLLFLFALRKHPILRTWGGLSLGASLIFLPTLRTLCSAGIFIPVSNLSCGLMLWASDSLLLATLLLMALPQGHVLFQYQQQSLPALFQKKSFSRAVGEILSPTGSIRFAFLLLCLLTAIYFGRGALHTPTGIASFQVNRDWTITERTCGYRRADGATWAVVIITTLLLGLAASFGSWAAIKQIPQARASTFVLFLVFLLEISRKTLLMLTSAPDSINSSSAVIKTATSMGQLQVLSLIQSFVILTLLVLQVLITARFSGRSKAAIARAYMSVDVEELRRGCRSPQELKALLRSSVSIKAKFREYCSRELCVESFLFLESVEALRATAIVSAGKSTSTSSFILFSADAQWKGIVQEFIQIGAPDEINISGGLRKQLLAATFQQVMAPIAKASPPASPSSISEAKPLVGPSLGLSRSQSRVVDGASLCLLDVVENEVLTMMVDTFSRFVRTEQVLQAAHRRASDSSVVATARIGIAVSEPTDAKRLSHASSSQSDWK